MRRLDPDHAVLKQLLVGRRRIRDQLHLRRDPPHHLLAAGLIEVVADRDHHRVLARPPDAGRPRRAALEALDLAARFARLAQPAKPFRLLGQHVLDRHQRHVRRIRLGAGVGAAWLAARAVGVLVAKPAERMPELMRRDERPERVAARGGRERSADAAVGVGVGDDQNLIEMRRRFRRVLARQRLLVLRDRDAARIDVRAAAAELHAERRVPRLADLRIACDAGLARHDLDGIHVDVAAVAPERLDAPQHVEMLVEMGPELRHLGRRVSVTKHDHREALRRIAGDLNRHDGRAADFLRVRRRRHGQRDRQVTATADSISRIGFLAFLRLMARTDPEHSGPHHKAGAGCLQPHGDEAPPPRLGPAPQRLREVSFSFIGAGPHPRASGPRRKAARGVHIALLRAL